MAATTNILQVSYQFTMDTKTYTNQVHYEQDAGDLQPFSLATQAAGLHGAVVALYEATLQNVQSASCVLSEIDYRVFGNTVFLPTIPPAPIGTPQTLQFSIAEETTLATDLPQPGDVAGDYLPGFNAFRARKITAAPGRRYRGHNSFPGIPEASTAGNLLGTTEWAAWQTEAVDLLGDFLAWTDGLAVSYQMNPVVLSLTSAQAGNTAGLASNVFARRVTTVIPNRLIGTMVRRKKKVI